MDVKTFSWGNYYRPKRFRKAHRCREVKVRQSEVDVDYRRSTVKNDRSYNGWDRHRGPGSVGNVLIRYDTVEGLAVGVLSEGSPHLLDLISRIVERDVTRRFGEMGYANVHKHSVS